MEAKGKKISVEELLDLRERGLTTTEIAEVFGVSRQTVSARISELQRSQGVLLKYREVKGLHLTQLQARILEAITPEKIDNAPLRDLVYAYKVLADSEVTGEDGRGKMGGLLGYLVQMEKERIGVTVTISNETKCKEKENENESPEALDVDFVVQNEEQEGEFYPIPKEVKEEEEEKTEEDDLAILRKLRNDERE